MSDDAARRRYLSTVIDPAAWDRAKWCATALAHDPEGQSPPLVGLIFEDEAAGRALFADLVKRVGHRDENGEVRVSIVEGPIGGEPAGYTVHISTDPDRVVARAKKDGVALEKEDVVRASRSQRVVPAAGSTNLAAFKKQYEKHGSYLLIPFFGEAGHRDAAFELGIEKRILHLRKVADVKGGADPDAVLLGPQA
jgi:hypothetical protein